MKFEFIFAWYDLWVGFFYDKKKRWLYFLPIPTLGIIIKLPVKWYFIRSKYTGEIIGALHSDDLDAYAEEYSVIIDTPHWCYPGTSTPINKKMLKLAEAAGYLK